MIDITYAVLTAIIFVCAFIGSYVSVKLLVRFLTKRCRWTCRLQLHVSDGKVEVDGSHTMSHCTKCGRQLFRTRSGAWIDID